MENAKGFKHYHVERPCGNCDTPIHVEVPVGKSLVDHLEEQEDKGKSVTCPNCGMFGLNHLIPLGNI